MGLRKLIFSKMTSVMEAAESTSGDSQVAGTGSSAGGLITAQFNIESELVSINIAPETLDSQDPETLQQLLLASLREGSEMAHRVSSRQSEEISHSNAVWTNQQNSQP